MRNISKNTMARSIFKEIVKNFRVFVYKSYANRYFIQGDFAWLVKISRNFEFIVPKKLAQKDYFVKSELNLANLLMSCCAKWTA